MLNSFALNDSMMILHINLMVTVADPLLDVQTHFPEKMDLSGPCKGGIKDLEKNGSEIQLNWLFLSGLWSTSLPLFSLLYVTGRGGGGREGGMVRTRDRLSLFQLNLE